MLKVLKESDLKETTKRAYTSVIKNMERYCDDKIENIYSDPERFWPDIESRCKETSTCRNNIKILMTLMRLSNIKKTNLDLYNRWYKIFINLTKQVDDQNDNNVQTDKSLNWENVIKVRDENMNNDTPILHQLVLGLYTYIPPRRQLDYWKVKIIYEDDKVSETEKTENKKEKTTGFLFLKDRTLVIHDFKTAKQFKEWKTVIPDPLFNIIKKYLESFKHKLEYLYCTSKGKPYSTLTSFTNSNNKILKQIFKNNKVSVNSLRHAAASYVNHKKDMTRSEKKEFAEAMGHSFSMQQLYVEAVKKTS
jgi:hypothetical protein